MNKHSTLRSLNSTKAFFLGQLEGQMLHSMARSIGCDDRADNVIRALNKFDFTKKLFTNYSVIEANKSDAQFIADYLCAINWMSHIYCQMAEPSVAMTNVLARFMLADEIEYFNECADYYCFAYDFLYRKFMNDRTIADSVKSTVYRIND